MNILPEAIPGLRAMLLSEEAECAALARQEALIVPADAAVARLRGQLAELDREATELANEHLPADQGRIARLIAGAEVEQLDTGTIEALAAKESIIAARRRQLSQDAAALQEHLEGLHSKANALRLAIADAKAAFMVALADAVLDAYKRNAIKFVRDNIPVLHSVASAMKSRTGSAPRWANRVLHGLSIRWDEDETLPDPERPGTSARVHVRTTVWPRRDERLLSGEPVYSDGAVDALIAAIREGAPEHQTRELASG